MQVALDPSGLYAYVANQVSHDVTSYSLSLATAQLTPLTNVATSGGYTYSIVMDTAASNPSFMFVGGDTGGVSGVGVVDFYSAIGGVLTLNGASPVTPVNDAVAMAVDPAGAFLFTAERYADTVGVYQISAGVLSSATNSPFSNGTGSAPAAVTVYPSGGFLYVAGAGNGTLTSYSYDSGTGALTSPSVNTVGSGASSAPSGVAIDPTGRFLYVTAMTDNKIYQYSIASQTGLLTSVGTPVGTGSGPADVKIEPSGHYLYVANSTDGTVGEYLIDPNTGALTAVTSGGTVVSGSGAQSIAIE